MKLSTSKYLKLYLSIGKLDIQLESLKWNQHEKRETLEKWIKTKNSRLEKLSFEVTEDEFEEHLSDIMCCSWEDFISNRQQ